jgi:hypothetical protein
VYWKERSCRPGLWTQSKPAHELESWGLVHILIYFIVSR